MFEKKYEFRYGDIDKDGNVKISSILDTLQDISISHSKHVGLGLDELYKMSLAWLLEGWRVNFLEPIENDSIIVKTGIMKMHHFTSLRKYEVWQNGILKIIATASWFSVDTEKMKVIIMPEDVLSAYDRIDEDDNELPFLKLRPMCVVEEFDCVKALRRDLDTNNHINNVKSAELALEAVPEEIEISELQITYRKALLRQDEIKICGTETEFGYYTELKNANDETCVLMNVIKK